MHNLTDTDRFKILRRAARSWRTPFQVFSPLGAEVCPAHLNLTMPPDSARESSMSRRWMLMLFVVCCTSLAPAYSAELTTEFVDGLRKQQLGDMAVYYLKQLEARQKIPSVIQETFDLELARSMLLASQATENVDEAEKLRVDTKNQLEKFLKAHPTHDQAGFAHNTFGDLSLMIGNNHLKQAAIQKDKARQEVLLTQARASFEEARPRFTEASTLFKARYDALSSTMSDSSDAKTAKARVSRKRQAEQVAIAENDWLNARFNLAMVDFHVAQTYLDPKHADVKPLLEKADKSLDSIWQGYRGLLPGVLAHYWTGRVNEQLGNFDKAIDIYEEVTGNEAEEGRSLDPYLAAFYAESFLQRARLLNQLNRPQDLIDEAEPWLDENSQRKTDPYFGVVVEVAKAYLLLAETQPEAEKAKAIVKVVRGLRDIIKVSSSHQNDAILLYRKYAKAGAGETMEIASFDEAVAIADAAGANREYAEAITAYERALALQDQEKDKGRINSVRYFLALSQLQSGLSSEAFAAAEKLAREDSQAKLAPAAAVLAINSALALCATATDKAAAEQQLQGIVDYTIQTWPNRAEADDARIALGRLKSVQNDPRGAIAAFEKVNPASDRHAQALNLTAQAHWRLYLVAKQTKKFDDAATSDREKALLLFQQALDAASKSIDSTNEATAAEASLSLGEVYLEANDATRAVTYLTPLEAKIRESNPTSLDNAQLRTLVSCVRAHAMRKNMEAAKGSAELLLQYGQDIPPVNLVLTTVARMLLEAHKSDLAAMIHAEEQSADALTAAQAAAEKSKGQLRDFLTKLAPRQQLSLRELIEIGDAAALVDQKDFAKATYQRALDSGKASAAQDPKVQAALIRVQAALIGLLRVDHQYDEALKQADALILSVPQALDPQIERARILQGLAGEDPSRYSEATIAWGKLRAHYQRMPKKPPVYYEIVYNTAVCLKAQADNSTDAQAGAGFTKQANQLLKATLALSPSLNGPDMVAKYQVLLDELK